MCDEEELMFFKVEPYSSTTKNYSVNIIKNIVPVIPDNEIYTPCFLLNPIRAGGGSYMTPPLVFFYPHYSCVRARDLKFYDFLNNIKTNLVILFFCQKVNFCGHRALAKNGRKKAS